MISIGPHPLSLFPNSAQTPQTYVSNLPLPPSTSHPPPPQTNTPNFKNLPLSPPLTPDSLPQTNTPNFIPPSTPLPTHPTHTHTPFQGVVIIGEGLFEGTDSLFHQPSVPTADVVVPLVPARNIITEDIVSRVLVATSFSSTVVRAFELRTKLPKLCMFTVVKEGLAAVARPISSVTMLVKEKVPRFGHWMESRFQVHVENLDQAETLEAMFQSLRDGTVFVAAMSRSANTQGMFELTIFCDDMDLAGDLLQDICEFMDVNEGSSHAIFPRGKQDM